MTLPIEVKDLALRLFSFDKKSPKQRTASEKFAILTVKKGFLNLKVACQNTKTSEFTITSDEHVSSLYMCELQYPNRMSEEFKAWHENRNSANDRLFKCNMTDFGSQHYWRIDVPFKILIQGDIFAVQFETKVDGKIVVFESPFVKMSDVSFE